MILLDASSTIEWILFIPAAILTVYLVLKLYGYIIAGLTKLNGKQLYVNGQKWADPNSLDYMIESDKKKIQKIKNIAIKTKERLSNIRGTSFFNNKGNDIDFIYNDRTTDKLIKIQKLVELKNIGALTEEEFTYLKQEIIKKG